MTALLAGSATPHGAGTTVLVGLAVTAVVVYIASCAWWPFGRCRKCRGSGRLARSDGKVFRLCPRCTATGRRLRIGRRLWNAINNRRKEGTR
jgi:hypothetical protein